LLRQDYPLLRVFLVTHGTKDPARDLARELAAIHPHVRHVEAGPAENCGQKNKNLLACLDVLEADTAVYVFCDAGHRARPDFVRELVRPILQGRAGFCTGYRRTRLCAPGVWAAAFHMLNRLMGLLESLPVFTQPWGGATAAQADAFRSLGVAEVWSRTVVDDCSLAGLLRKHRTRALYRPTALLDSPVFSTTRAALDSWFFRQLAYPKFYTFGPWLLIGAVLVWFALVLFPAFGFALYALSGAYTPGTGGGALPLWSGIAALAYLPALLVLQELLRRRIAASCPRGTWLAGLAAALWTTYANYARTVPARQMTWRGLRYSLAGDGRVLRVE
jgi:cellulose synthase/poly-beta-1,6-N-acetylglucosamine synthase-like glycosyltransferase